MLPPIRCSSHARISKCFFLTRFPFVHDSDQFLEREQAANKVRFPRWRDAQRLVNPLARNERSGNNGQLALRWTWTG
jgi:hypothetical protein